MSNEIPSRGGHKIRSGKEEHLYNPQTIHALQNATKNNDYELFKQYSHMLKMIEAIREELGERKARFLEGNRKALLAGKEMAEEKWRYL